MFVMTMTINPNFVGKKSPNTFKAKIKTQIEMYRLKPLHRWRVLSWLWVCLSTIHHLFCDCLQKTMPALCIFLSERGRCFVCPLCSLTLCSDSWWSCVQTLQLNTGFSHYRPSITAEDTHMGRQRAFLQQCLFFHTHIFTQSFIQCLL